MTSRSLVLPALVAFVALTVTARPRVAAAGGGPEQVFAGQVITSDKRFPLKAKSPGAYTALIRKQKKASFREDDAKKWHIYFAAFFRKPLADIEVIVKLYDHDERSGAPIASFEQYVSQRGGRALLSEFTLEKALVPIPRGVRNLDIVLEVGRTPIARGRFTITGEGETYSGKVDFSGDDDEE
jgi:hypothetical protein